MSKATDTLGKIPPAVDPVTHAFGPLPGAVAPVAPAFLWYKQRCGRTQGGIRQAAKHYQFGADASADAASGNQTREQTASVNFKLVTQIVSKHDE